ncbi:MAG: SMP-30/gluconolactonase/LRE family protein [Thiolinea sp.]
MQTLYPSQCHLGEGPFWYQNRCHWFDIVEKTLHSCTLEGREHQALLLPEMFSAAAPLSSGDLLLASESALWRYQGRIDALEKLCDLEADKPQTRSNDGRADRQGGFWIGTMGKQAQAGAGALYRYYQGELVKLVDQVSIPNAICFSPAGDYAYFTDTPKGMIRRWALDSAGWPVGEAQDWVAVTNEQASPDGAVVDSAGYLWNAQWGSGQVVRYSPAGQLDRVLQLPALHSSCPAFVGADFTRMMITTAQENLDAAQLSAQPQAGDVFIVSLEVPGLADGVVKI